MTFCMPTAQELDLVLLRAHHTHPTDTERIAAPVSRLVGSRTRIRHKVQRSGWQGVCAKYQQHQSHPRIKNTSHHEACDEQIHCLFAQDPPVPTLEKWV